MWPLSAGRIPARISSRVVLPAPLGPISPRISPRRRSNVMSCSANCPVKLFVTRSIWRKGFAADGCEGTGLTSPLRLFLFAVATKLLEVRPQVGNFLVVPDAGKDHLGAWNLRRWSLDVILERIIIPNY